MTTVTEHYKTAVKGRVHSAAQGLGIDTKHYVEKSLRMITREMTREKSAGVLIKNALENIDESSPEWTYVASSIYLQELYHQAAKNRSYDAGEKYGDFYDLIATLTSKGIYSSHILDKYSKAEIQYFFGKIQPERDWLFDYLGLYTLATRYLATDHDKNIYELPQERWMIIAMYLMQDENREKRTQLVEEAYWALSNLYMTVATPTLNNAGKSHGKLSRFFINLVDDSNTSCHV